VSQQAMTRAFYLDAGIEPIFAMLDEPTGSAPVCSTAVLICPPFGWQDVSSYRARRDWARELAAAGHVTLRIDLPGSGDSGGWPRDGGRFAGWIAAIAAAAVWLRREHERPRIAAIGIGLGGVPLYRAAVDGAPIDDLVLWGMSGRGRMLVREQRAFARLEQAQQPATEGAVVPEGALISAGFLLSSETLSELESFDVSELPPPARVSRALLLERDGISVDERLRASLTDGDVEVTAAPGPGFADMLMAEPQDSRLARETVSAVAAWIAAAGDVVTQNPTTAGGESAADARRASWDRPVTVRADAELVAADGTRIREAPLFFAAPAGRLFGVLTEPVGPRRDLCLVMLNAGAQRRIGVNRMWVELARRWAARGVPSLRLDLEGIGDADGESGRFSDLASFYVPEFVDDVRGALDDLERRGLPSRFVVLGLCSGAYWSLYTALADRRVAATLMLNTRVLVWDQELLVRRESERFGRNAFSAGAWRRIASGQTSRTQLGRAVWTLARTAPARARAALVARRRSTDDASPELERLLDQLRDRDQRGLLLFTAEEPVHEELERDGYLTRLQRWPNLRLAADERLLSGSGEDHTLRPLWLQQYVHALLDAELEHELDRLDASDSGAPGGAHAVAGP
jgi:alpha-beta hydrolase superfamily lysophospholipase